MQTRKPLQDAAPTARQTNLIDAPYGPYINHKFGPVKKVQSNLLSGSSYSFPRYLDQGPQKDVRRSASPVLAALRALSPALLTGNANTGLLSRSPSPRPLFQPRSPSIPIADGQDDRDEQQQDESRHADAAAHAQGGLLSVYQPSDGVRQVARHNFRALNAAALTVATATRLQDYGPDADKLQVPAYAHFFEGDHEAENAKNLVVDATMDTYKVTLGPSRKIPVEVIAPANRDEKERLSVPSNTTNHRSHEILERLGMNKQQILAYHNFSRTLAKSELDWGGPGGWQRQQYLPGGQAFVDGVRSAKILVIGVTADAQTQMLAYHETIKDDWLYDVDEKWLIELCIRKQLGDAANDRKKEEAATKRAAAAEKKAADEALKQANKRKRQQEPVRTRQDTQADMSDEEPPSRRRPRVSDQESGRDRNIVHRGTRRIYSSEDENEAAADEDVPEDESEDDGTLKKPEFPRSYIPRVKKPLMGKVEKIGPV